MCIRDSSHTGSSDEPTCLAMPYLNSLCCKMVTLHIDNNTEAQFCQYRGGEKMAYLIGFDIGTESVGWAVTDEQLSLIHISFAPALSWICQSFPDSFPFRPSFQK